MAVYALPLSHIKTHFPPVAAELLLIWDILLTLDDEVSYSPHFQGKEAPDIIIDQAHMVSPLDIRKVSLFFRE